MNVYDLGANSVSLRQRSSNRKGRSGLGVHGIYSLVCSVGYGRTLLDPAACHVLRLWCECGEQREQRELDAVLRFGTFGNLLFEPLIHGSTGDCSRGARAMALRQAIGRSTLVGQEPGCVPLRTGTSGRGEGATIPTARAGAAARSQQKAFDSVCRSFCSPSELHRTESHMQGANRVLQVSVVLHQGPGS